MGFLLVTIITIIVVFIVLSNNKVKKIKTIKKPQVQNPGGEMISIKSFDKSMGIYLTRETSDLIEDIVIKCAKLRLRGETHILLTAEEMKMLDDAKTENEKRKNDWGNVTKFRNDGYAFEKNKDYKNAIISYEKSLEIGESSPFLSFCNYSHGYDRLMKVYRRVREYEMELRTIDRYINQSLIENERIAQVFIKENPELENETLEALETNQSFRYGCEGKYYRQYDVLKLYERRQKAGTLLKKLLNKE